MKPLESHELLTLLCRALQEQAEGEEDGASAEEVVYQLDVLRVRLQKLCLTVRHRGGTYLDLTDELWQAIR